MAFPVIGLEKLNFVRATGFCGSSLFPLPSGVTRGLLCSNRSAPKCCGRLFDINRP